MSMEPKLSELEREIWKKAYDFHEEFCDMENTEENCARFALRIGEIDAQYQGKSTLMRELLIALYNHLEAVDREKLAKEERVEQVTMPLEVIG